MAARRGLLLALGFRHVAVTTEQLGLTLRLCLTDTILGIVWAESEQTAPTMDCTARAAATGPAAARPHSEEQRKS